MFSSIAIIVLFFISLIAANIPFMSEKVFLLFAKQEPKSFTIRVFEWLIMYLVTMSVAMGLETKFYGELYPQGWEFYSITICLFTVFSLPGFIYQYDLRKYIKY